MPVYSNVVEIHADYHSQVFATHSNYYLNLVLSPLGNSEESEVSDEGQKSSALRNFTEAGQRVLIS